jgi:hypothetical protein
MLSPPAIKDMRQAGLWGSWCHAIAERSKTCTTYNEIDERDAVLSLATRSKTCIRRCNAIARRRLKTCILVIFNMWGRGALLFSFEDN